MVTKIIKKKKSVEKKAAVKKTAVVKKAKKVVVSKSATANKKKATAKVKKASLKKTISKPKIKKSLVPAGEKRVLVKNKPKKPKIAIVSLTSCEGCQFVLLDLGTRFLDFASTVEMVDFRLIEDDEDDGGELDLVLVEGNPVTEANHKTLLSARKRAKILVALGNCAAMGGIPEIKNYHAGAATAKHVYKYIHGISNPEIKEIDNFVKVDFTFPGCPITGEEFLKYMPELLSGKIPVLPDQPVCIECKAKGNTCLLLEKKPCFGPMILGGCDAVCPTARMGCQGCRGLRPGGNVKAMKAALKTMMTDEEFENTVEIYGLRDDIEERERKQRII